MNFIQNDYNGSTLIDERKKRLDEAIEFLKNFVCVDIRIMTLKRHNHH